MRIVVLGGGFGGLELTARLSEELGVSRRTVLYRLSEFTDRAMKMQRIVEA